MTNLNGLPRHATAPHGPRGQHGHATRRSPHKVTARAAQRADALTQTRPGEASRGSIPSTLRISRATARATRRELIWGLRRASLEIRRWRARAALIPNPELRADALRALDAKRGNIHGAALFCTLPNRRDRNLLATLVAYEVLADYLDCVSERGARLGTDNGRQLHLAMIEALDPAAEISDYYRHHSSADDGGYLDALVRSCRATCVELPSYQRVRAQLLRAASLALVLALNHEPDPARRDNALRQWALSELTEPREHTWYERSAGASAWLTVLAMLALAANPRQTERDTTEAYHAYLHWIAPAAAMLDSYSDIAEDTASAHHSYISHYTSRDVAIERVSELLRHSRVQTHGLCQGERHTVVLACMIAFYLSKDSVRTAPMRRHTRELRRAGGPLVAALLPLLRAWRTAYGQRSV
jgi:tetraprenyl-beta-curcumene synthase